MDDLYDRETTQQLHIKPLGITPNTFPFENALPIETDSPRPITFNIRRAANTRG